MEIRSQIRREKRVVAVGIIRQVIRPKKRRRRLVRTSEGVGGAACVGGRGVGEDRGLGVSGRGGGVGEGEVWVWVVEVEVEVFVAAGVVGERGELFEFMVTVWTRLL